MVLLLHSVPYILYMMYGAYLVSMEDTVLDIGRFRQNLGDCIDNAYRLGLPTVIKHGKRRGEDRMAALVPYAWLEELRTLRGEVQRLRAELHARDDATS